MTTPSRAQLPGFADDVDGGTVLTFAPQLSFALLRVTEEAAEERRHDSLAAAVGTDL